MNITLVAGARPNFIKLAPIILAADKAEKEGKNIKCTLIYTGAQEDATLEDSLFCDLCINKPDVFLGVDCTNLNELTGKVMAEFDVYLEKNQTDAVIVVDDLASTMAAAIVTKKRGIMLAHLVAGTRSFDITMPKEINRLVIDGLSDLLFTAGISNNSIANKEGASLSKVYMVGNVLIDTLRHNYNRFTRPQILSERNIEDGKYIVLTVNRKALLCDKTKMKSLTDVIKHRVGDVPIIAPVRNLAAEVLKDCGIEVAPSLSYLEFGYLTAHAMGIITDSGNVAEEATFNTIPCITLNSYTEHMETVNEGTNVLVGEDPEQLNEVLGQMLNGTWKSSNVPERWDGRSSERIISILLDNMK